MFRKFIEWVKKHYASEDKSMDFDAIEDDIEAPCCCSPVKKVSKKKKTSKRKKK